MHRPVCVWIDLAGNRRLCDFMWGNLCVATQGEIGVVAAGAAADLLLVDGNPLDDITLLTQHERIRMVIKEGLLAKVRCI